MKKSIFFLISAILFQSGTTILSQTFIRPNYALKSHPTLEIKKVELTPSATKVWMTIENRIEGGAFCADRNIYIVYPDGSRLDLISSSGIPVCPDSYKFKAPGEKLDFVLTFSRMLEGTKWFDLIEDCSDNCFSFYGVLLDEELNRKIDEAFSLAEGNQPSAALINFIKLADEKINKSDALEGLLYLNIIKLSAETGNKAREAEWYYRLQVSGIHEAKRYIKYLNDQGIKY